MVDAILHVHVFIGLGIGCLSLYMLLYVVRLYQLLNYIMHIFNM